MAVDWADELEMRAILLAYGLSVAGFCAVCEGLVYSPRWRGVVWC